MATPIKRIEKDFLLKVLYDEQLPVILIYDRLEYTITVDSPAKTDICLKANKPIPGLKAGSKIDLMFDYRSQVVSFSVVVGSIKDDLIIAPAPEFLYKNLARSFSRVHAPADLKVDFSFRGDRYALAFPKIQEFEQGEIDQFLDNVDPKNLKELVAQLSEWANDAATGHKLVLFKGGKPVGMEEKILAETGKALFLPSTQADVPQIDPYPKKRLITEDLFKRFLEGSGVDPAYVDDALDRFVKAKRDAGIYSDAWAPLLFQEYVIGYIHIWINAAGKPPFDYGVVDTLYQFAKILVFSLRENGYFNAGKLKKQPFQGKVVDISVSGLLFAYPHSALSATLMPDSELDVRLSTPKRTVSAAARIVRKYKDSTMGYFGLRFLDIAPEDMRFLFEFIYGKPFTDQDATFLAGKV